MSESTPSKVEARATSLNSLASLMPQSFFGSKSMLFLAGQLQKHGRLNIGARQGLTTPCGISVGNLTLDGLAASLRSDKNSTQAVHGKKRARLFGSATMPHVNGVNFTGMNKWTCHFTFTTSFHLPLRNFVQIQSTSFCFAKRAINSFILERT